MPPKMDFGGHITWRNYMSMIENCRVLSVSYPREGAIDMTIHGEMAKHCKPGQFLHIKCSEDLLLRRPISLCDADSNTMRLIIEDVGAGTKWLIDRKAGDILDVLGPLGDTGFPLPQKSELPIMLIGGGVGVAPLLMLAKQSASKSDAILGFRNERLVMMDSDFATVCRSSTVCTDDGSYGRKGFVTEVARELLAKEKYEAIYACGNMNMLRAVKELAEEMGVTAWLSLDERMGCGLGACLVCACKTNDDRYVHVCKDGPVFDSKEVSF